MFKIEAHGQNRIDMELGGKLDRTEMIAALDDLVSKSKDIENGKMLYRIVDFDMPTLGAMGAELSRLPELYKTTRKFDRAAILCDRKWIQKASEIEGALIPGLSVKAFDLGKEAEAEAWMTH